MAAQPAPRAAPSRTEVERAFADAMQRAGFLPGTVDPDNDKFTRFDAPGDKRGKRNGFYKLRTGQWPVGWFGDWKTGEQHQWSWHEDQGVELSEADKRKIREERARLKAEAQQARELRQVEVAEDASRRWGKSSGDCEGHPYLERKQIEIPRGLRVYTAADGTSLLTIPMYAFDMNGSTQLVGLQHISPNGEKRFMTSQRVEGAFFSIKGDPACIVICEGVATAFSVWQATGLSTVAAFNASNLIPVAKDLRRWRSQATLLIAADDDAFASDSFLEAQRQARDAGKTPKAWENAGVLKAQAAASAVGCKWVTPVFEGGPKRGKTDFNDLYCIEGKTACGGQILGAVRSIEPETVEPGAEIVHIDQSAIRNETWRSGVPTTANGQLDGGNVEGVAVYIANHPKLAGRLRYNNFTKEIELDGNPMEDYHVAQFRRIMHMDLFKSKKGDVADEMVAEARRNYFDPLTDYLSNLKWDLSERLDTWTVKYLGTEDTPYTRAVGRAFLIGAVARALEPGCKNDNMLVLEGPQGIGKSTAIRYLFGDRFFTDHLPDFHSKDSFQQLQGSWCIEVAELSALSKAEVKDVKQFLSRLVDKFRAPYEKLPLSIPRRSVFVGTVNPEDNGYLRDPTGNRRFWPIECGAVDLEGILTDRNQIWAEAVIAFRLGEKWFLMDEAAEQAAVVQAERGERHPWEALILEYLTLQQSKRITVADVLTNVLKIAADKQNMQASRQAGAALRGLGWSSRPERLNAGAPVRVFYPPEGWTYRQQGQADFERLAYSDDE
jgi:putative DNA primase/helicase